MCNVYKLYMRQIGVGYVSNIKFDTMFSSLGLVAAEI